jgi:glucokinase
MILAGDIGGTHARLAFFDADQGKLRLVSATVFPSRDYGSLDEILRKLVSTTNLKPDLACFGIAGPVRDGKVEASNLPWIIESAKLANELHIPRAILINDLEAGAWGIAALEAKDLTVLNPGAENAVGNRAVIAAGTGLGEAGMYWDGTKHNVFACEGGHCDFAPRNELEIDLLVYLKAQFGRVSYERVLSGPGLVNVFDFLRDTGRGTAPKALLDEMHESDPAAAVSRAAISGDCPIAEQALDIFVSIYGAEAGNLALKVLATGGVYIAGGIAPKIAARMSGPLFLHAFLDKGRLRPVLASMPVNLINNDQLALLGAARCALVKSTARVQ